MLYPELMLDVRELHSCGMTVCVEATTDNLNPSGCLASGRGWWYLHVRPVQAMQGVFIAAYVEASSWDFADFKVFAAAVCVRLVARC
jgi:hypothetical protein